MKDGHRTTCRKNNQRTFLALPDMGTEFRCLPEGRPDRSVEAPRDRLGPQRQNIET